MTRARGDDIVSQLTAIERAPKGSGTLSFPGGATLAVTNLGKLWFPGEGISKGGVMRYYARVAPVMLPLIADRPLVLKRFPDGIDGPSFYQQVAPAEAPDDVRVGLVNTSKGKERRLIGGDLPTLLYTVQLGAIDVHPWLSRVRTIQWADYSVLDLDPGPRAGFARAVRIALRIHAALKKAGYRAAIKTSGSRGLHVFIPMPPRTPFPAAQEFGRTIAAAIATQHPKDATVERMLAKRPGDAVYIDFLQNAEGKSVAGPFSLRARKGATASAPLAWSEVTESLDPAAFTIATVPAAAARRGRLWLSALTRRERATTSRARPKRGATSRASSRRRP
ncbi:MAG TPA: non-homologous end-joining DNA ligase [Gemmatimonadaceae bacterium]|nr:non-homologous end-joining DNA ligase [Gemmatimonadaceae bacterium]